MLLGEWKKVEQTLYQRTINTIVAALQLRPPLGCVTYISVFSILCCSVIVCVSICRLPISLLFLLFLLFQQARAGRLVAQVHARCIRGRKGSSAVRQPKMRAPAGRAGAVYDPHVPTIQGKVNHLLLLLLRSPKRSFLFTINGTA